MCAIFGLIQNFPFSASELASMSRLMRHRGPDDEGFAIFENVGEVQLYGGIDTPKEIQPETKTPWFPHQSLPRDSSITRGGLAIGHRRLSILDLSPNGHQPMSSSDGRYWITFNGEVYNYVELREELKTIGHRFKTESDTEVILAAFSEWQEDCLARFNGMWALAIFDRKKNSLFLARDRFGVKPLYYWQKDKRFAFASEIKAFTALQGWRGRADTERLLDFLVWNILDHSDRTMFDCVKQLPAGHHVTLDLKGLFNSGSNVEFKPKRWYSLPKESSKLSHKEAIDGLKVHLTNAVKLRLRADVPVGSCLSGGLDSSAIVCLMGEILGLPEIRTSELHTFTARSHDEAFDEFKYAQAVIDRAKTTANTTVPEPHGLFEDLDNLTWHQDEPFVSTSIFAQWCVFRLAKMTGIKVMLDGQGADEILGGYRGYFGAHLAGLFKKGAAASWLREITALQKEIGFSPLRSIGYTLAYLAPSLINTLGRFDGRAYGDRKWLSEKTRREYSADPLLRSGKRPNTVHEMSISQITATNLPMLLHWEDRNSMAHSVEARVPFLDYRVVEHCLSIADSEKVGGGISKLALREAMRTKVPDSILDRRDKMGFVTAETHWVRRDEPKRFRKELLRAVEVMPTLLSNDLVKQFDEVLSNRRPFDHRYWRAISAASCVRNFNLEVSQ